MVPLGGCVCESVPEKHSCFRFQGLIHYPDLAKKPHFFFPQDSPSSRQPAENVIIYVDLCRIQKYN